MTKRIRWRRSRPIPFILIALAAVACDDRQESYVPGAIDEVLSVPAADLQPAIAARLDSAAPTWVSDDRWARVKAVYGRFDRAPLWLEEGGVKDRARALLGAIEEAPSHALSTEAYPIGLLRRVVNDTNLTESSTAGELAEADVLLTAAYVAYASDMLAGQVDPRTISQAWYISRRPTEIDSALAASLQSISMTQSLAAMVPRDSAYAVLRAEYARYRSIADSGGWPLVAGGSAIRPGRSADPARIGALRLRLQIEGFLPSLPDSAQLGAAYDTDLADAVRRYQARHGLDTTGVAGLETVRALNVTAADRSHQIASNMERFRWLPRALGSRYVVVNVPAFRLEAYDSGRKVLEMKVAVGAEYDGRATPVFSDSIEYVVFHPFWNVPSSIAQRELWPKIRSDPSFAGRNGYEIYVENGARRIRQRPGETNALGHVKFMFPNSFNIYLHDTPDKSVFLRENRAVSAGCIRLERPDLFGQFVLGWSLDRVRQNMQRPPDNRTVTLEQGLAVYIVYFTVYVRDGQIAFAEDLYRRDAALDRALIDSTMRRHGADSARNL